MTLKSMLIYLCLFIVVVANAYSDATVNIGSKRFTESYIIGEMLKQIAQETGEAPVDYRAGLGNTGIVYAALQEGLIDVYPEYSGTVVFEMLKRPNLASASPKVLNDYLNPMGLAASESLGFQDGYALAMTKKRAQELGISKISDLAHHPELIFGFSSEFLGRLDGWPGLKKSSYHFPQKKILAIDHSLGYEALMQNEIDLMDIYSTDPKIKKYGLLVLEDDYHFFPMYDAILLYRTEAKKQFPKTWDAFERKLINQISEQQMINMNSEAELEDKSFSSIVKGFLTNRVDAKDDSMQTFWQRLTGPDLWLLTKQHLFLVFGALIPAIIVGIILGVMANYWPVARHFILNAVGIIQTFPSIALLAFLIPVFKQIGTLPALVALFLYSLLPIVRNTYAGMANIAPSLQDSALALGLPFLHRLTLIELPLASPTILAGIKTAAVLNVGMATIAAFIGAGGYGDRIVAGLALNDYNTMLAGAIPACILAICVQLGFDFLDYCLIPRGLRKYSQASAG